MHPPIPAETVAELASILRRHAAGTEFAATTLVAEWSQVAAAYSGRVYRGGERQPLPSAAAAVFAQLQEQMRDESRGVWFSARIEIPADPTRPPECTVNYSDRVYWNSPAMLQAPAGTAPVPSDAQWSEELSRNPRAPEFTPDWITAPRTNAAEFSMLREALSAAGVPLAAVRLPGEAHPTFEGAILVRDLGGALTVDVFDYGQLHHLGIAHTERDAGLIAWNYLTSPMPAPVMLTHSDVEARAHSSLPAYADLRARIMAAGAGGVVTNLAPGIPYDRWGTIDGLYLYAWATPTEERALPPSATGEGAQRVGVIANRPVSVQAEIIPPWFDQPGGGIRFRPQAPIRHLIRAGELSVIVAAAGQ